MNAHSTLNKQLDTDERLSILIVDDDKLTLKLLKHELSDLFDLRLATSGKEALSIISREKPTMIMTDLSMPGMNGSELINTIKEDPETSDIPYIITTGNIDDLTEAEGLEHGAADFIRKPFDLTVLRQRVIRVAEDTREKNDLKDIADKDPLTGAFTRRYLTDYINALPKGENGVFSVLDLDHFKSVNDRFGHREGDTVIRNFYTIIRKLTRQDDVIARIGGDEFALWFGGCDKKSIISRRLSRIINITMKELWTYGITVSIGAAIMPEDGSEFETLYQRADEALYHIKNTGKCSYEFYSDMMTQKKKPALHTGAMLVGREDFSQICDYLARGHERYGFNASIAMFSFEKATPELPGPDELDFIRSSLRSSDVVMQYSGSRFAVLLTGADPEGSRVVARRISKNWNESHQDEPLEYTISSIS
ncbi:MAG: diguanylate cyclase [Eubacterium sp.]|nr:diguanylate cyclase [Eubacterium sp.]